MKITDKITITNEDCMDLLKRTPDNYYSLSIVDPPYGIGESKRKRGNFLVKQKNGKSIQVNENCYSKKDWDDEIPNKEYFFTLISKSKLQIVFGANYFEETMLGFENTKPPRRCEYDKFLKDRPYGYIIWDKMNGNNDFNDCEIIYVSLPIKSYVLYYMWNGMMQGECCSTDYRKANLQIGNKKLNESRIHPTQKPVALYKWLLDKYAKEGDKILDTHLGSGSIAIAAHDYGYELTCCELDVDYYNKAVERIKNHVAQMRLEF